MSDNVLNVHNLVGSPIQQGANDSTQTITRAGERVTMATRREQRWKLLTEIARRADDLTRLEALSTNDLYPEASRQTARASLAASLKEIARAATAAAALVGDE